MLPSLITADKPALSFLSPTLVAHREDRALRGEERDPSTSAGDAVRSRGATNGREEDTGSFVSAVLFWFHRITF